jgi:tRNA threonylcarbamoyladenosine biosynthesis protein TsaE
LGAGKTAFVRGAARALGVSQPVTSPTYTVGNRYDSPAGPVSHIDLYRSRGLTDEEWADLEPYFAGAICFVEWPERGGALLPAARLAVSIHITGPDARLIVLDFTDSEAGRSLADPEL